MVQPLPSENAGINGQPWPEWITLGLTHLGWERDKQFASVTKRGWGIQLHRHWAVFNYHVVGDKMWWLPGFAFPRSWQHWNTSLRQGFQSGWFTDEDESLHKNSCHDQLDAARSLSDPASMCYVAENDLLFVPHFYFHAVCSVDGPNLG